MDDKASAPRATASQERSVEAVARLTGQLGRLRLAKGLIFASAGFALMALVARSAYGRQLNLSGDLEFLLEVMVPALSLAGMVLHWRAVRCPRCGVAMEWRRVTTQPLFSKTDEAKCLNCGYCALPPAAEERDQVLQPPEQPGPRR
jgi:hypothetical protein